MYVLGIQTAEFPNEVGISKMSEDQIKANTRIQAVMQIAEKNNTVEQLASVTQKLLNKLKLDVNDIGLVSVCIGPGSYTGLRGGLAFAKGFCQFSSIKLIGVTSFEVLAYQYENELRDKKRDTAIHYILDAKNDRVFSSNIKNPKPSVLDLSELLAEIGSPTEFVGSGAEHHKEKIVASGKKLTVSPESLNRLWALGVAATGYEKIKNNPKAEDDVYALKPDYVLPPHITKPRKKR